jgi:hypothetical protein
MKEIEMKIKKIGLVAGMALSAVMLNVTAVQAIPGLPTGLGPDQPVLCGDGHTAYWNPGWGAGHDTPASAVTICNTWHQTGTVHSATAGQYVPPRVIATESAAAITDLKDLTAESPASNTDVGSTTSGAETAIVPPPMPNLACCTRPGQRTTLNLSTGSASWSVKLPSGATVTTANSANVAWTTTVIPTAHWISPVGNPATPGNYVYSTQFDASNCRVRCTITVSGKFLVDNKGVLKVDGVTVASSLGTPMYGFLPGSVTPFSYNIPVVNGVHTITFEAFNQSGPTGADIELLISRLCGGRVALQESSAPVALAIPTPTGCNPNNLPGAANPC